jgi:hypothetical protein
MRPQIIRALTIVPALIVGAYLGNANGVPLTAYLPNLMGFIVGLGFVACLKPSTGTWIYVNLPKISVFLVIIIGFSLAFTGTAGVHRWVSIGPINLNVSVIFLPAVLYVATQLLKKNTHPVLWFLGAISAILVAQPDAGQMTAFGVAAIFLLCTGGTNLKVLIVGTITIIVAVALSWSRHDPLLAVDHVERVFYLASEEGPLVLITVFLSLIISFSSLLMNTKKSSASIAMIIYIFTTFMVTAFGNFPVPLIGAGASTILGWLSAVGLQSLES